MNVIGVFQHGENKPWWRSNFLISEPVLFGTWDGVFTSCMINIFGVVIFLRTGWMVVRNWKTWSLIAQFAFIGIIIICVKSTNVSSHQSVMSQSIDVFILQGNAGIGLSMLIIVMTIFVAMIAALSAIGVCERCKMERGGVYFLLSHVLGARIGASVGILYCFGQVRLKKYMMNINECLNFPL